MQAADCPSARRRVHGRRDFAIGLDFGLHDLEFLRRKHFAAIPEFERPGSFDDLPRLVEAVAPEQELADHVRTLDFAREVHLARGIAQALRRKARDIADRDRRAFRLADDLEVHAHIHVEPARNARGALDERLAFDHVETAERRGRRIFDRAALDAVHARIGDLDPLDRLRLRGTGQRVPARAERGTIRLGVPRRFATSDRPGPLWAAFVLSRDLNPVLSELGHHCAVQYFDDSGHVLCARNEVPRAGTSRGRLCDNCGLLRVARGYCAGR